MTRPAVQTIQQPRVSCLIVRAQSSPRFVKTTARCPRYGHNLEPIEADRGRLISSRSSFKYSALKVRCLPKELGIQDGRPTTADAGLFQIIKKRRRLRLRYLTVRLGVKRCVFFTLLLCSYVSSIMLMLNILRHTPPCQEHKFGFTPYLLL
ncbi:LADA_0G14048g1_1 [Lachancea dasiensis]|uniref:LADA_0G14048g1_1 n=1 Tax=Lachancea dasiensis TaxID=1072105 RepID=A0A1G4JW33_9SACH|nr:LADA_0G14048g1_1 [Lachancea dasiensis]